MAVAALCLLLLASSPGSPCVVGELIGLISLVAGLGSAFFMWAHDAHGPQGMTSEMREKMREEINTAIQGLGAKLERQQQEKLRKIACVSMVVSTLGTVKWWTDREHQSEMHQKDKEHQRKMQERDDAYQKDMQARDKAHESKLFLSKMCDEWVSIICKVCGILTLAYLLRYHLLVPGPARAIEMPVPGHAWVIANP